MPAFNCARFVNRAIESVRYQSFTDWELIVIDDGSTDGTAEIVRRHATSAPLQLLQQENCGPGAARNRGLAGASGELVAFLDADDAWAEEHLAALVAGLWGSPAAVLAFSGWRYIDAHGTPLPQAVVPFDGDAVRARHELPWRNALVPSAVVARAAAVRRIGGFDATFDSCADWDLWLRLLGEGQLIGVPRVTTFYRAHDGNMSDSADRLELGRLRLVERHHGAAPSSVPTSWSLDRRRAVGHTLFASGLMHLRQRDGSVGRDKLRQALGVWPELVEEDEFHFELACAFQARGVRGTGHGLRLSASEALARSLRPLPGGRRSSGRLSLAFAQMALLAGEYSSARRYAAEAVRVIALRRKPQALAVLARSILPGPVARRLRARSQRPAQAVPPRVDIPPGPTHPAPAVTIIVLGWNGGLTTADCINAVLELSYPNWSLLVVDNGSTDGSAAWLRAQYPWLEMIETGANLGFAGGVNVALSHVFGGEGEPDYVWLLNNDARPEPHALTALVELAERDRGLGAVGSVLVGDEGHGRMRAAWGGGRVNCWSGLARHHHEPVPEEQLEYLVGASLCLRRDALHEIGTLDDRLFLYWEDTDLCFRLRKAGWRLGVASGSIVRHCGNGSMPVRSIAWDREFTASSVIFFRRHASLPLLPIIVSGTGRMVNRALQRRWSNVAATWSGLRKGMAR